MVEHCYYISGSQWFINSKQFLGRAGMKKKKMRETGGLQILNVLVPCFKEAHFLTSPPLGYGTDASPYLLLAQ